MSIQMTIEMAVRKPNGGGYYETQIDLPALNLTLEDAKQRVRLYNVPEPEVYLNVYESNFGDFENVKINESSLEELNYLAKRLDFLSTEESFVFGALYQSRVESGNSACFSVKDIINMTYGLDVVPIASNVSDDYELGRFVVENSFDERFDDLPESMLKYLDYTVIGKEFRERDDGEFVGRFYVPTRYYEQNDVYDGEHIPESEEDTAVFRMLIAKAPEDDPDEVLQKARWICLPANQDRLDEIAKELGAECIQDCVFYDFQSAVPQIDADIVHGMRDIETLDMLASLYRDSTPQKRMMIKAAMEAEHVRTVDGALKTLLNSDFYEYSFVDGSAEDFYKTYFSYHAPTDFDSKWIAGVIDNRVADRLMSRLGASVTSYGVISKSNGKLFDLVGFDEPERFDVIEILGQPALFSNGRIPQSKLPDGMYRYDFREDETHDDVFFGSIEPNVTVNHAGSFVTKIPIDFGEEGYIILNYDTEPNFLGEEMTIEEFAAADFSEDNDETIEQTGGISL